MRLATLVLLLALPASAAAATRFHFDVQKISVVETAPPAVSARTGALLDEIFAARPDQFGAKGGKGVKDYGVSVNLDSFERTLAPNTKPGATGQLLTIRVNVQLVGTTGKGVMAMAGTGHSTVMAEVGANVRPREEELAIDDALRDALTHAVDEAVTRLSAPPPRAVKPARRKRP